MATGGGIIDASPILQRNSSPMQGMLSPNARRLLMAAALLALAACGTAPPKPAPLSLAGQAAQLEQSGHFAEAAAIQEKLAAQAQPPQHNELLLSAAEDWLQAGDAT